VRLPAMARIEDDDSVALLGQMLECAESEPPRVGVVVMASLSRRSEEHADKLVVLDFGKAIGRGVIDLDVSERDVLLEPSKRDKLFAPHAARKERRRIYYIRVENRRARQAVNAGVRVLVVTDHERRDSHAARRDRRGSRGAQEGMRPARALEQRRERLRAP